MRGTGCEFKLYVNPHLEPRTRHPATRNSVMFQNPTNNRRIPRPLKGLFFLVMAALFVFVLGNVIMFLWNEILADATSVKTIKFWEAVGLFVLFRILFGGFRFGPKSRHWRNRARKRKQRWMNMNEEERAEFKAKWKERCGPKFKAKDSE